MSEGWRETGNIGPFLTNLLVDAELASLATKQHGVFTLDQLVSLGLTPSAVRKRAAAGKLHRLYRGVYSLVPPELVSRNGRWLAAVYACGPGAVLSHATAAALHGVRRSDAVLIDVTVPGSNKRSRPRIRPHRSTTLTNEDVTIVEGIPVTTVARTLFDLAGVIARRPLERALDQAAVLEVLDLYSLHDQIERNHTCRGATPLRTVLKEHYAGSTLTWSDLEERCLRQCRRRNMPRPEINAWVDFDDGEPPIRADFLWRQHRLILETDGYKTHRTRRAFQYDRALARRARRARWELIRATDNDFRYNADEVFDTVQTVISDSQRSQRRQ